MVEKGKDLFYQVMVKHGQRKKWFIDRTFNQFCELHKKLDKKIPNMPILPSKTLFKPTFQEAKKRKIELEKYLNVHSSSRAHDMLYRRYASRKM